METKGVTWKLSGILILTVLTAFFSCAGSVNANQDDFKKAKQLRVEGAAAYDVKLLEDAKALFIQLSNDDATNYIYPYYTGLTYLDICNVKNFEVEKAQTRAEKKSLKAMRVALAGEGVSYIDKSIKLKDDFSESHRVKGALISYQISGMFSGMRLGGKADDAINRALNLDAENLLVKVEIARKLIYNPAIAGGDLDKGMETLQAVINSDPKIERAYILLGMAYEWSKDKENAVKMFNAVLKMNPKNAEARFFYDDITASK